MRLLFLFLKGCDFILSSSNKKEIIIREKRSEVFLDVYKHGDTVLSQTCDLLRPELTLDFPQNYDLCQHENTIHKAYKFDSLYLSEKLKVEIEKQMPHKKTDKHNNDIYIDEIILTSGDEFMKFPKTPRPNIVYDGIFKSFPNQYKNKG